MTNVFFEEKNLNLVRKLSTMMSQGQVYGGTRDQSDDFMQSRVIQKI